MRHTQRNNRIIVTALALFFALLQTGTQVWAQTTADVKTAENNKTTENKATKNKATKNKSGNSSVKKDKVDAGGVKELSGISIIGNKEAPKSLYIVPWKNSEVGIRSSLTSGLLDGSMQPIDKEVFIRELDFYELSHSK